MNTYERKETVVLPQQPEPTILDKAKELLQQVGEKIGLVDPAVPTPTYNLNNPNEPQTFFEPVPVPATYTIVNTHNDQKSFTEQAKENFSKAGENVKETLVQAGEKLGLVNPESSRPPAEQAKENISNAGARAGTDLKWKMNEFGEKADELKEDVKNRSYDTAGKAGLVFPYTNTEGLPKPLASENAKKEILEARDNLGLAQPEETKAEFGHGGVDSKDDRPLSSEKIKEEILEARDNFGLKKPIETIPERGHGLEHGQNKALPA